MSLRERRRPLFQRNESELQTDARILCEPRKSSYDQDQPGQDDKEADVLVSLLVEIFCGTESSVIFNQLGKEFESFPGANWYSKR
jgi:hypothetical protein